MLDMHAIKIQKGVKLKTKSIWGQPPSRLYGLIRLAEHTFNGHFNACVVGCSDGKFVFPFARKGHHVTGYDVDKSALYGATKEFPIYEKTKPIPYTGRTTLPPFPTEPRTYKGCIEKVKIEGLNHLVKIEERDFYALPPKQKFDVVFTSCSYQYSLNASKTLEEKTKIIQEIVSDGGYLYIDYMMAIDEQDYDRFPENKYLRKGQMATFFPTEEWQVLHIKENNTPSFEHAHTEHPYHHYHRFGYVLAQKRQR